MGTNKASSFVAKNTFLMTLGLFTGRLMGFFILRRLAGLEGPHGIGIWGTAVDLTSIILTLSNFGLATLITREIIKDFGGTRNIFLSSLRVKLLLGVISYLGLIVYVYQTGYDDLTRQAILVMALGVILETVAMACDSVLQAYEKVEYQTYSQLVSAAAYIGFGWWWLSAGYGVMGVLWANVASRAFRLAVVMTMMFLRTGPWSVGSGRLGAWAMARLGLPVFLSTTFGVISFKIDTVMIMEMLGEKAAGIYTIGHRPLDLLLLLPYTFALAMFPSLQRYKMQAGPQDDTDFMRMSERALRYLHVLFLPLSVFCVLAADPMIALLAQDPDFGPSANVFRIVIWGLPLQAANTVYNRVLLAHNREKDFIAIALTAMITNVGLNLLLIPRYGWNGAAGTTVFSLLISYLMHRRFTRRAGVAIPTMRGLVGGTGVMLGIWSATYLLTQFLPERWRMDWFTLPFEHGWLAPIVLSSIAILAYCLLVYLLGIVRRDDVKMLMGLWPGR